MLGEFITQPEPKMATSSDVTRSREREMERFGGAGAPAGERVSPLSAGEGKDLGDQG